MSRLRYPVAHKNPYEERGPSEGQAKSLEERGLDLVDFEGMPRSEIALHIRDLRLVEESRRKGSAKGLVTIGAAKEAIRQEEVRKRGLKPGMDVRRKTEKGGWVSDIIEWIKSGYVKCEGLKRPIVPWLVESVEAGAVN